MMNQVRNKGGVIWRHLIYPNIIDIISDLQSGGIADMEMRLENDLKRSFFHDNKQFAPRKH